MPSGTTIERRVITVLIADLVGFTSLSEQLDAEDIQIIQDAYFASVEDVVGRYGGMVQKYIGDAAVATFGLHRAADDDPERAVRAGLALVSAVQRIGERLGMEPDALSLRVGVNTGEVVYSEGGPTRGQFTGDSVNVAARLQTAASPGSVLLGQTTALAIVDSIETARVGPLELKGKGEPQPAWEALSIRAERSRDLAMGQLHAPTVGRRAELQWLLEALNDVRRGAVKSQVVVAPPGVGKSRLVAEFAHMVEASAATPVWLARVEAPLALFDVVRQLLDAALRTLLTSDSRVEEPVVRQRLELAGARPARAAAVAGQLVSLLAGSDTGLAARSADRDALFSMWIEGLDALAHPEAAVWVVEDVHWASGDLLAFLAAAGQVPTGQGRLILATARPSILERAPGWLQSDDSRSTAILQLDPLPQLHSVELIRALVGVALPDDVVATIADRSDGNPLFIEELLRLWTSVGLLELDQAGTWRLMQPPMKVEVPTTVHNIYEAQLDDLPESAREVARRAGVAGRRFPDQSLNELGVEEPETGLTVLSTRVLIEPTDPDELLGPSHTYRHALLRDAGYATLPKAERARLHVRLARWLEKTAGDDWPALAAAIGSHFDEALCETPSLADEVAEGLDRIGVAGLASVWLERAGQVAVDQAESDSARVLFQRALDLTPDDATIHRSRRLQRLGEVTAFAADMNQGAQQVGEAREIARVAVTQAASNEDRMAARTRLAEATAALAWIRQAQLRLAEAAQLSEEALTELGEDGPSELVARLLSLNAFTHYGLTNRFDDVKAEVQLAINLASAVGSEATELDVTEWMFYPRVVHRALLPFINWDRSFELASSQKRWTSLVAIFQGRALAALAGDGENPSDLLGRAEEIAEAHGLTESLIWNEFVSLEVSLASGHWTAALAAGRRAIELGDRLAYTRVAFRLWTVMVHLARERAEQELLDQAWTWWEPRRERVPRSPLGRLMIESLDEQFRGLGLLPARETTVEELRPSFEIDVDQPSWYAAIEWVLQRWLEAGRIEAVIEALQTLESASWERSTLGRSSLALVRGHLLAAQGGPIVPVELASSEALYLARKSESPWWTLKAIRLLEAVGLSSTELTSEGRVITEVLGIGDPPLVPTS